MKDFYYEKIFHGTAFQAPEWGKTEILKDCLFCTNDKGFIADVFSPDMPEYERVLAKYGQERNYIKLREGEFFLPGFVDLHIHAPQWVNMGKALHVPLEVWLQQYTFPLEGKMGHLELAETVYRDLVESLLLNGTTTALYLGSQDKETTLWLGSVCAQLGQRGCIGKVTMDNPAECPDFYRDKSPQKALEDTEDFIIRLRKRAENVPQGIIPVVTPRFVPSCTDESLAGMGELARKYEALIQTHVAESNWQANYAYERFNKSDANVLADFGLLTDKTVLAHGTLLSDEDAELLAAHGTTVAHCPISNAFFGNAVYPVRKRYEQGVNAGIGTDVSGGFSPSMYDNIRQAVIVSRMLEDGVNGNSPAAERGVPGSRIDYRHALYMATVGGGRALGQPIGLLRKGYAFDAQIVSINTADSNVKIFSDFDSDEDILQKILFLGDRKNIVSVWVQGRDVFPLIRRQHE